MVKDRTLSSDVIDRLKSKSFQVRMHLRELYIITQWKDGCIYKTRSLGFIVCKPDYLRLERDIILASLSTKISMELY